MTHRITLLESLVGLAIGVLYWLWCLRFLWIVSQTLDKLLSPLVTISQTIPIVTIAPLLVLLAGVWPSCPRLGRLFQIFPHYRGAELGI